MALLLAMLAVLTLAAYSQVVQCGFISFDDTVYVVGNDHVKHGFTFESVRWAFTSTTDGNWFPLTWLSYMLDSSIAGTSAAALHVVNLLYHLINSYLLFVALYVMCGHINRSALVAALFALHPLHVESVVWISERKDLLSTLFFLLTLIAYKKFQEKRTAARYMVMLALFACGLMSKPMLVSLPLLLLLLDYWPLKRFGTQFGTLLIEKVPLFVLSLLSCVITYNVQNKRKAMASFAESPLVTNINNAIVSYASYLYKTFVPAKLSILYPFRYDVSTLAVVSAAILLITISSCAIVSRKDKPYLMVGWLWYLISLVPVIGIIRVGNQSMADRYTYIPHIGLFIALVWGCSASALVRQHHKKVKAAVAGAVLVILSAVTYHQVSYWKSNTSLFSHAVEVTDNNWVALGILGYDYFTRNELDKAHVLLEKSLAINPDNVITLYNMGLLQNRLGNFEQSLRLFQQIVKNAPDTATAHYQIGLLQSGQGNVAGALHEYSILDKLDPELSRQLLDSIRIQKQQ